MRRFARILSVATIATPLAATATAQASTVPACPAVSPPSVVLQSQGQLESVLVDRRGRLLFTDRVRQALLVVPRRGAAPRILATGIADPGGIVEDRHGRLLVGFGNNAQNSLAAPAVGGAGLYAVDPLRGRKTVFLRGLSMANGVVRAPNGTLYASSVASASLDRVLPGGQPERAWATPRSSNGLALRGPYLFANVSLPPTEIVRIDTRDPSRIVPWAAPPAADANAFLDGLTRGRSGRLLAAAFVAGEVWRADGPGRLCVLARGLPNPSSVALGRGRRGFRRGAAYVATYGGTLVELPRADA